MTYKLGRLFDGSGGFPLAGSLCDIEPVWAAEVEPYPVAVTRSRFPNMKHYGDVSKINGAEVEPVNILSFGAPCQDLSVAGLRKGLRHEANGDEETTRSGLFMEAVRIIREMREATNGRYPDFAVYENVPGAFSSSGGEDWRTVLQSLIQIVEPTAVVPDIPKGGWAYADWFMGCGWSLAYRVLDAQYWGVPQRRRRIYLVLDLRGERAGKILFEREGLRGYFAQGGTPWQAAAGDAEGGVGADDRAGGGAVGFPLGFRPENVRCYDETATTIVNGTRPGFCNGVIEQYLFDNHSQDARYRGPLDVCPMLPAQLGTGGNNQPFVVEQSVFCKSARARSADDATTWKDGKVANTLNTIDRPAVAYSIDNGQLNQISMSETCNTLDCMHDKQAVLVAGAYSIDEKMGQTYTWENQANTLAARDYKQPQAVAFAVDCRNRTEKPELYPTLQAKPNGGQSLNYSGAVRVRYIVRRLTPTECARLQGFPDFWGHPDHKDSLTDEEAEFWRDVHLTDCAINGKKPKPKIAEKRTGWESATCDWYNKLHTDSAEYKMWGNGIAIFCCLYVMQGIEDALKEESKWTS